MPDQLDQAQLFEELRRYDALREQSLKPAMPFKGECYNCGAPVLASCFCDIDCRDDYEKLVSRHRYEKGLKKHGD